MTFSLIIPWLNRRLQPFFSMQLFHNVQKVGQSIRNKTWGEIWLHWQQEIWVQRTSVNSIATEGPGQRPYISIGPNFSHFDREIGTSPGNSNLAGQNARFRYGAASALSQHPLWRRLGHSNCIKHTVISSRKCLFSALVPVPGTKTRKNECFCS